MTPMTEELPPATPWQTLTSAAADVAVINTAGVAAGLLARLGTGQDSYAPVLVWLAVALVLHVVNGVWLTGRSGQSVGDRVARIASVSPATGRPAGVATVARVSWLGAGGRDGRLARVSVAREPDREADR